MCILVPPETEACSCKGASLEVMQLEVVQVADHALAAFLLVEASSVAEVA